MMAASGYDDLQLRIDRDADGTYRVLAMAPDGRTARGSFTPPLSDTELDDFVQRVGLARRRSGSADTRMEAIRALGSTLFDALIKDDVGTVFYSARSAASERDRGLRITLRLSGSPELMRLPWEFLYKRPRFIAQSTNTPVVRALDIDSALRPHKVRLPLRILAMVSSPAGYPELDAELERRNLERALAGPRQAGLVEVTWLDRATLGELGRRIAEPDEIHVLHYIGHGAYNEATESGVLVLETPQGRAHDVSGEEVGAMLQDETSLRLVVLNACEGARSSHVDPFSGVAASLVNFDIPAVIGMQFEITDDAAIAFSESLYTGLALGLPIDAALAPARRAIIGAMLATEFGTPVLFLRDGDAHLFDIAEAPADVPLGPPAVPTTDEIAFESGAPEPEVSDPVAVMEPVASDTADVEEAGRADVAAAVGVAVEEPETEVVDPIPRAREEVVEPDVVPIDEVPPGDEATAPAAPGPARYAVPVALAWIAAALIAATVVVVFIINAGQRFEFGFVGIIAQLLAMTALSVHYFTRPNRDGVAAGGYAVAAGLAVFALSSFNSDFGRVTWAYLVFGVVLILVGARLVYVGRKGDSPFLVSLRTPGPFVIAAGTVETFTQLTLLTNAWDWRETANWFWSIGVLGMAVSYAISARLLAREVKAQRDGHDSRGIRPARFAVPVVLAWIAAALIAATVVVVFIINASQRFELGFVAIIAQLLAMTALSVHYLTRPKRDGVAAGGYAVTAGLAVFALSSINVDSARITWAYLFFGVVLIVVGARLVYVGRKGDSPFLPSLRTPGPFVIAAGAAEAFTQLILLTSAWDWMETANWFWSIGVLGMAVSYAISARLLAREVKAQRDGRDSRGI